MQCKVVNFPVLHSCTWEKRENRKLEIDSAKKGGNLGKSDPPDVLCTVQLITGLPPVTTPGTEVMPDTVQRLHSPDDPIWLLMAQLQC